MRGMIPISILFFKVHLVIAQCATVIPVPVTILDCGMAFAKISPQIIAGATATNALIYQWIAPTTGVNGPLNQLAINASAQGIYTLVVSDSNSMCVSTSTMAIVYGQLSANASAYSTVGSTNLVSFINLSSSTLGSTGINTVWNFANGQTSVTANVSISPVINYSGSGTYLVTLICTKGTCTSTFSLTVYPGLPNQNFVGLKEDELEIQYQTKKYFDLLGNEQALEKNKLLIEQVGTRRRKVIISE